METSEKVALDDPRLEGWTQSGDLLAAFGTTAKIERIEERSHGGLFNHKKYLQVLVRTFSPDGQDEGVFPAPIFFYQPDDRVLESFEKLETFLMRSLDTDDLARYAEEF